MAIPDLSGNISTSASSPQSASGDAGSVSSHPLPAQIQADRYLSARAARSSRRRGMMLNKIIPAAAFPDAQGTGAGVGSFDHPGSLF
jgi:hypothetical protein